MRIVSFDVDDLGQIQEMVTRPLGDVEAWDMRFCQTERGAFSGSYVGTALPSERSPLVAQEAAIPASQEALREALTHKPVIWAAHHRYNRRFVANGAAPSRFLSFLLPVGKRTALNQKGQTAGARDFVALAPGDELETFGGSDSDFLSVMIDPGYARALLSALGEDPSKWPSGVFMPNGSALRSLKGRLFRRFEPRKGTEVPSVAGMRAAELDIEESLIAALDVSVADPLSLGLRRRQAVARLARDYLEANSDRPIALPELCAVTGVSVRTLNYAFKLSFGIPPGAYHFFQRLRLARDDLLRSHRAEASVTQIAYDRGFWHLGRFAVDYRSLFGEPPSHTLYRRA